MRVHWVAPRVRRTEGEVENSTAELQTCTDMVEHIRSVCTQRERKIEHLQSETDKLRAQQSLNHQQLNLLKTKLAALQVCVMVWCGVILCDAMVMRCGLMLRPVRRVRHFVHEHG